MNQNILATTVCAAVLSVLSGAGGCKASGNREDKEAAMPANLASFDAILGLLKKHADAVVLEGEGGARVLVSPRLQGRVFTLKVGAVESTGFVNAAAIQRGETDPAFNNFGGADRFWIYPEAGQFGLYFDPGAEFDRKVWKVPASLDRGPFKVVSTAKDRAVMTRDMEVMNYIGVRFKVRVDREVAVSRAESLPAELGVKLPEGVHYAGVSSRNTMTNTGAEAWKPETGLIGIWILGMLNPSDSAVVIGPFRPGSEKDLGPAFNDEYFGKVSVEAPDRLKVLGGNAVVFKADAKRVGKFGISQQRTTGVAGSIDFAKGLLTVVKFDVPPVPERYGNSTWVKNQPEPFKGDALQSYNNGPADPKSGQIAEIPFYELESTSPVRPLAPGESIVHRHATHHFQGDLKKLAPIAQQALGVDLMAVKEAMGM